MAAQDSTSVSAVIISEIAWQGNAAGSWFEWLELYNSSDAIVDLSGWHLSDQHDLNVSLNGQIPPKGFFLLERLEEAVNDQPADQLYFGTLSDAGETLVLSDPTGLTVDLVDGTGGWPAGTAGPEFRSMERKTPLPNPADWIDNDTIHRNGFDTQGNPINGTPRQPNSAWSSSPAEIDLALKLSGPLTATSGSLVNYTIRLTNTGSAAAPEVVLVYDLPGGFNYFADDAPVPASHPVSNQVVWELGTLNPGFTRIIQLTTRIGYTFAGAALNRVSSSTSISETDLINNEALWSTNVYRTLEPNVLIDALHYYGYENGQPDEAVCLINVGGAAADLSGWSLTDGESTATFPAGIYLQPGEKIWIAQEATAFRRQFGMEAAFEVVNSDPDVPDLAGSPAHLNDSGDEIVLTDINKFVIDALVYLAGNDGQSGWSGPSVTPYVISGVFAAKGQILYRLRDQQSGWPVPDTNTASDWAQANPDPINGRRVLYPGWDVDQLFLPQRSTEPAEVKVGLAPDNAHDLIIGAIAEAQASIKIESLSFRSLTIGRALIEAVHRGVEVTVLLEGDPPGGIDDQELYACQHLELAGGACWFMISDSEEDIYDRYDYLHAKFLLIDDHQVAISTENLSPDSMPDDDKSDGTWGRRGVVLLTNATGVVDRFKAIWQADFDPADHVDLFRWHSEHEKYGRPPPGTIPITLTGGTGYSILVSEPWQVAGIFTFETNHSPENTLRDQDGLLGLLARAGPNDVILSQQLSERPHWGPTDSDSLSDPNPRVNAYLAAARRGAHVRLLLDNYLGSAIDPVGNEITCADLNKIATAEMLDLACQTGNPTGLGIHNKMVLAWIDGQGFLYLGSLNGTELSHKGNREVGLLVQSDQLFQFLAGMFESDWPKIIYFPILFQQYQGPATHVLISEVLYDPTGPIDDDEFIEIVNPTQLPIALDNIGLADAVNPDDFEDQRLFPTGTVIQPDDPIIVATTATGFKRSFGFNPDFEILNTDPSVPELIDDPQWGDPAALLRLGNAGDEIILRTPEGEIIDAVAYGTGQLPGMLSCPLVASSGRSLERYPYWRDSDDCPADFRDWPLPNPGYLP